MAQVPLEAADTIDFVPPSLSNIENPPNFRLRAGTRRDRDRFKREILAEGLHFHDDASLREAAIEGLRSLWSPEDFAREEGRIRQYWDAVDAFAKTAQPGDTLDYDPAEQQRIAELWSALTREWAPLRQMAADNRMFGLNSPSILLSILLVGWTGIDVPFGREGGLVSLDRLEQVETALRDAEERSAQASIEGVGEPGTAFDQLRARAGTRMFLSPDAEKNLSSPPPSSPSPPPTKTDGEGSEAGQSKASATSPTTPVAS